MRRSTSVIGPRSPPTVTSTVASRAGLGARLVSAVGVSPPARASRHPHEGSSVGADGSGDRALASTGDGFDRAASGRCRHRRHRPRDEQLPPRRRPADRQQPLRDPRPREGGRPARIRLRRHEGAEPRTPSTGASPPSAGSAASPTPPTPRSTPSPRARCGKPTNRGEFLDRARDEAGVRVEVDLRHRGGPAHPPRRAPVGAGLRPSASSSSTSAAARPSSSSASAARCSTPAASRSAPSG